jgi:hypothetical protein
MASSRVNSLINKVNRVLNSTNAFDRKVYLRTTTSTGGDPLLGRYGTVSVSDVLLSPQPYVERLGRERIPGGHTNAQTYLVGSSMKVGDDYSVLVSSTMVSLTQLQDPQCQFVFKDTSGNVEVLTVHDFETVTLDGSDIAYQVYCRSGQIT